MTLGEKISWSRKRTISNGKKLTQKDIASKIGVGYSTILRWEKDTEEPKLSQILEIAKIVNQHYSFFCEEKIIPGIKEDHALYGVKISEDIKDEIKELLVLFPKLSEEKRKAIISLCK